jgi:hypothetical protein
MIDMIVFLFEKQPLTLLQNTLSDNQNLKKFYNLKLKTDAHASKASWVIEFKLFCPVKPHPDL